MGKNAQNLSFNKLIILILVALVIVVVGIAAWKMGLLDYLKGLPGFNQTATGSDLIVIGKIAHYTLGDVKVLLDDGEGRCIVVGYADESKKINNDFYGLYKKELIWKNPQTGWQPIGNDVATDVMIWKRELKDKLTLAINNLSFEYSSGAHAPTSPVLYEFSKTSTAGTFYFADGEWQTSVNVGMTDSDKSDFDRGFEKISAHIFYKIPEMYGPAYYLVTRVAIRSVYDSSNSFYDKDITDAVRNDAVKKQEFLDEIKKILKDGYEKDRLDMSLRKRKISIGLDSAMGLGAVVGEFRYWWNGAFYYEDKAGKDILIDNPSSEQSEIKNLIQNSVRKNFEFREDHGVLFFDSNYIDPNRIPRPLVVEKIIGFQTPIGGYQYGMTKTGSKTTLVARSTSSGEWKFVDDKYLSDNSLWTNMTHRQKIKEDLTRICSSR